jgi:predicted SprT family Zn-dependent metalloprotease
MTNEEYFRELAKGTSEEQLQDKIRALVETWVTRLSLQHWTINLTFDLQDAGVTSDCRPLWQYLSARIRFNLNEVTKNDDPYALEYVVVHELTHILVAELKANPGDGDHEERVVSHIAMALQRPWPK